MSAFAAPYLSNKVCMLYAPEDGDSNSNFAYTFYGLTIGTDWKGAEDALSDPNFAYLEGETTEDGAYRIGLENIKQQPGVFFKTLTYNMFHSLARVAAEVGNTLFSIVIKPWGITVLSLIVFGGLCVILFIPATWEFIACLRQRNLDQGWFWGIALLAIFATFPIIIRDGSYRVLAGVYPLMIAFGAALLKFRDSAAADPSERKFHWVTLATVSVVMLGSFTLPWVAHAVHPQIENYDVSESSVTSLRNEITGICVVADASQDNRSIAQSFANRTAIWEVNDFRHAAHASRAELVDDIKELEAPFTLLIALEGKTGIKRYLVIPDEVVDFREKIYRFELGKSSERWWWVESFEQTASID
ncbi:MAG: hypothetical protein AAF585_04070 [Verrucomicrobiota bacterium]